MKALLLVIDGLGMGAMPDVSLLNRPQDIGANTFATIKRHGRADYPFLESLGISNLLGTTKLLVKGLGIKKGLSLLHYEGADAYAGHLEMIGSQVSIEPTFLEGARASLFRALKSHGEVVEKKSVIILDAAIFISNNVESEPGYSINVIGSLQRVGFEKVLEVGNLVRKIIKKVPRVIVMGGTTLDESRVLASLEKRKNLKNQRFFSGVNVSRTGIFNDHYVVAHLGLSLKRGFNLLKLLAKKNYEVALVGKTATLFNFPFGRKYTQNNTDKVFEIVKQEYLRMRAGLIFANVSELDLAGHEQDISKGVKILKKIDNFVSTFLSELEENDIFMLTADHGNDPAVGHSQHTREMVPIILAGKKIVPGNLGTRKSLSDIGCTLANLFGLGQTEMGESFLAHS